MRKPLGAAAIALLLSAPAARADDADDAWDDPKPPQVLGLPPLPEGARAPEDPSRAVFRAAEMAASTGRKGTLAGDAVKAVVREHLAEIRFCYERAKARRPDVSGRVTVRFVVGEEGTVTAARVDSTSVDDEPLERCVVMAVRRWSFPRPSGDGPAILSWPFSLVGF